MPRKPSSTTKSLGRQIKQARLAYKMSQSELACSSGTTQAEISRLERGLGNPTLHTLEDVARVFRLKMIIELKPRGRHDRR